MQRTKISSGAKRVGQKDKPTRHKGTKSTTKGPPPHIVAGGFVCDTDTLGYRTPKNRSITEIVLDASNGFIPLWAKDSRLRWRFKQRPLRMLANPKAKMDEFQDLFGEALLKWGDAAPIKFEMADDAWDFEVALLSTDDCEGGGCVLASAFFPDAGRHELTVYPKMFSQSRKEQVDTLIHEIGHVFGLRHFFANISETAWPSEIFGVHKRFTIMNYGADSELTPDDKSDLKRLYQSVWSGALTHVNGTPIRLVKPYHTLAEDRDLDFRVRELEVALAAIVQRGSNGGLGPMI